MNKQITVFCGCLIRDGKILMIQRNEEECPQAHLKWEFPGGKVDYGETPQESLEREFLEETGITIKVKKLIPYIKTNYWKYEWGEQQTLCFYFICELIKEEKPKEKDHHVEKIAWIKLDEIKNLPTLPGINETLEVVKH